MVRCHVVQNKAVSTADNYPGIKSPSLPRIMWRSSVPTLHPTTLLPRTTVRVVARSTFRGITSLESSGIHQSPQDLSIASGDGRTGT